MELWRAVDAHTGGVEADNSDQCLQIPVTLLRSRTQIWTRIKMKSQIHNKGKRGIRIRSEVTRIHNLACDKTPGSRYKESLLQTPLWLRHILYYPTSLSPFYSRLSQPLAFCFFKWRKVNDLCAFCPEKANTYKTNDGYLWRYIQYIKGQSTYYTQPFQRSHLCSNP
jgi:hypothetical protein